MQSNTLAVLWLMGTGVRSAQYFGYSVVHGYRAVQPTILGTLWLMGTCCRATQCFGYSVVHGYRYTDKKENKTFLKYKEIQMGSGAKSYMTNGLLIYGEKFAHFLIY
jgi:hypothetical protein